VEFQLDGWMFYKTLVDGTGLDGIFFKRFGNGTGLDGIFIFFDPLTSQTNEALEL
jgi:hypothetical protein